MNPENVELSLINKVLECLEGSESFTNLRTWLDNQVGQGISFRQDLFEACLDFLAINSPENLYCIANAIINHSQVALDKYVKIVALGVLRGFFDQERGAEMIANAKTQTMPQSAIDPNVEDLIHISRWLVQDRSKYKIKVNADSNFLDSCKKLYPKLKSPILTVK